MTPTPDTPPTPESGPRPRRRLSPLAAAALAFGGMTTLIPGLDASAFAAPAVPAPPLAEEDVALDAALQLSTAFERVADRIGPSVVAIEATRTVTQRVPSMPFPFGNGRGQEREFEQGGQGSGFIIRSDGYIVTNNHVVAMADEITVALTDERRFPAEIVGTDPATDLAVLRIDATDLPTVGFGDPEALRPGQWVVAAGNPFGLSSTITAGIVSATGRRGLAINRYEDFVQTDAAINPGNSGGPLVNLYGDVVGVNTAIVSRSGGNMGIGFAIPVSIAESVVDQLIAAGSVTRGYLGVRLQPLDDTLARRLRFEGRDGAVVVRVEDGTPAAEAGLDALDIITGVNGTPIDDREQLSLEISRIRPGEQATIEFWRDGRRRTATATIAELPTELVSGRTRGEREAPTARATDELGLQVRPLSDDMAAQLGLEDLDGGLLVTGVRRGSPASEAGMQARDVIVEADGRAIRTLDDWNESVDAADRERGMLLVLESPAGSRFVVLDLPPD